MSSAPDHFHPHQTPQRPMFALGLRLLSALVFSVVLLLVKLTGERGIWLPEALFWRQLIPATLILGWLASRGDLVRLRTARPLVHARRAAIGTLGMVLTLGVVQLLPLAEATVLAFTSAIFAVILSVVLLREKVGIWRVSAVALGMIGVIIMTGPSQGHLPVFGVAVGIGAAFMVALVSIQLRELGRTEEPITIVFYFSAMSAPFLAMALPFTDHRYQAPFHHDLVGWLMIGAIGVLGLATQMLMTAALRYGRVASVIVMDYAQFGWSTLWGWLVFDHLPPTTTWLGAPAIIGAGLIIAWREQVRARPQTGDETVTA